MSKVEVDAAFKEYDKNKVRWKAKISSFFEGFGLRILIYLGKPPYAFKHACTLELRDEWSVFLGFVINSRCYFPLYLK